MKKTGIYDRLLGERFFEITDHLGNTRVVISDVKIPTGTPGQTPYDADVLAYHNYYPFGMLQPGRSWTSGETHRYLFNNKESDNEVSGTGNQYDYGFRIYNPRIAKFLSVDPLTSSYPSLTPYQFASNTLIWAIDLDGLEASLYLGQAPFSLGIEGAHEPVILPETEYRLSKIPPMAPGLAPKIPVTTENIRDHGSLEFTPDPAFAIGYYWRQINESEAASIYKDLIFVAGGGLVTVSEISYKVVDDFEVRTTKLASEITRTEIVHRHIDGSVVASEAEFTEAGVGTISVATMLFAGWWTAEARVGSANRQIGNSFDEVASYIRQHNKLPDNFITKNEAKKLGWDPKAGNLDQAAPGKSIGGDMFKNKEGLLPGAPGRVWYQADINYSGGRSRSSERILYSNDGLIYKTTDHYKTFTQVK